MPSLDSDLWRIRPRKTPDLAGIDTGARDPAPGDKAETKAETDRLRSRLIELQERLYAEHRQSLLVVLQAMDAGGKDGTIRAVFGGVNPQGVNVTSFKAPTEEELAHDVLWRIHQRTPGRGHIGIFNRSHYEDVLIVRVHELVPEPVWRARYARFREFEAGLVAGGTAIVKIMLHISRDEQRERLQERIDIPEKRWKFNAGDLAEREHWDDYQAAYADAIRETTTKDAPWFVVPADHNWYRNWAVMRILVDRLEALDPQYPEPAEGVEGTVIPE